MNSIDGPTEECSMLTILQWNGFIRTMSSTGLHLWITINSLPSSHELEAYHDLIVPIQSLTTRKGVKGSASREFASYRDHTEWIFVPQL